MVIVSRKCQCCGKWRAESETEAVYVGPDTFYVCGACIAGHQGPGKFEGLGDDLGLALVLHSLSMDGCADFMLTDESQGYAGQFHNYVLTEDDRGFVGVETFGSPDAASEWIASLEDDGFGASEDDAWISYDRGGLSVTFDGKHVGTYETLRRARAAVSLQMRKHGYYPNVFLSGEHGPSVRRIEVW